MVVGLLRRLFGKANQCAMTTAKREPVRRFAPRLEGLEERLVPAVLFVDDDLVQRPNAQFTSIQAALDVARPGDTIKVYDGVYQEAINITKNNIKLVAETLHWRHEVKIVAPPGLAEDAVIDVSAKNVEIRGFVIDGGGNQSNGVLAGVRIISGSATIHGNVIKGLYNGQDSQFGFGIQVGLARAGQVAQAKISNNILFDYQKGGILVDNDCSHADVRNNVIIGVGASAALPQYGVQVSRGASADIQFNLIKNNDFDSDATTGAGILVYETSAATKIERNLLLNNQTGIYLFTASNARVFMNDVLGGDYGIALEESSNFNLVKHNDVFCVQVDGISLYDSDNNWLTHNRVFGSGDTGFYLENSDDNLLFQNWAQHNGVNGIYLFDSSDNRLKNNRLSSNGENSILIELGAGNLVSHKPASANGFGKHGKGWC